MRILKLATAFLSVAFIFGAGLEKCSAISSPILLTINDADPSAVTITATGFAPIADGTVNSKSSGIDLLTFFSGNEFNLFGTTLPNSTLTSGGSGLAYRDLLGDNFSAGGDTFTDLRLYLGGPTSVQTFSTLQPAFSGSWTIDFTSLGLNPSALPTAGSMGDILDGFSGDAGPVIGQWEVAAVPEPSIASLIVLASVIGAAMRWRRTA
jgi:hypothetical protein